MPNKLIDLTLTVTWCTAALVVLDNGAVDHVWGCRVRGERGWLGLLVLGLERHLWPAAEEVRCREHGWDGAALAEEAAPRSDAHRRAVLLNGGRGGLGWRRACSEGRLCVCLCVIIVAPPPAPHLRLRVLEFLNDDFS